MIPEWLCQCGCGKKTKVYKQSDTKRGRVRGKPYRYVKGHGRGSILGDRNPRWNGGRTTNGKYQLVHMPGHPRADKYGYVRSHILVAEKALGKPILKNIPIHHFPSIEQPVNLVICQDITYHALLHLRYRALKACGNVNWRKCSICHQWDDQTKLIHPKGGRYYCHRSCKNTYQQRIYANNKKKFALPIP